MMLCAINVAKHIIHVCMVSKHVHVPMVECAQDPRNEDMLDTHLCGDCFWLQHYFVMHFCI